MKKFISLLVLNLVITSTKGQPNLIPNPSFEQYYSCPNNNQQVDTCIGWKSLMFTPDYYNRCTNVFAATIPNNGAGYQDTYDGDGYMGLISFDHFSFWHEIIGAKLIDSLIAGYEYNFSMRISRGNWVLGANNITASNKIGARFTTYEVSNYDTSDINNNSQVFANNIITDSANWVLLTWNFFADSNYKFISIGNFFDDAHTDTINFPIDTIGFYWEYGVAYYFIDSLNLKCISTQCFVGNIENESLQEDFSIQFNQNILTVISYGEPDFEIAIYNSIGQLLLNRKAKGTVELDVSLFKDGVYFVNAYSKTKAKKVKITKF